MRPTVGEASGGVNVACRSGIKVQASKPYFRRSKSRVSGAGFRPGLEAITKPKSVSGSSPLAMRRRDDRQAWAPPDET